MKLLDLVLPPRLPMPLELGLAHLSSPASAVEGTTQDGGGLLCRTRHSTAHRSASSPLGTPLLGRLLPVTRRPGRLPKLKERRTIPANVPIIGKMNGLQFDLGRIEC